MSRMDQFVLSTIKGIGRSYGLDVWDKLPWYRKVGGGMYNSLWRLEREGLLAAEFETGDPGGRRVYWITDAGEAALRSEQ